MAAVKLFWLVMQPAVLEAVVVGPYGMESVKLHHTHAEHVSVAVLGAGRCRAARIWDLPAVLSARPENNSYVETCEMRCSDPQAADVSCGGTFGSFPVYVFKGSQGECCTCAGGGRVQVCFV
jgi:hypothetical protein